MCTCLLQVRVEMKGKVFETVRSLEEELQGVYYPLSAIDSTCIFTCMCTCMCTCLLQVRAEMEGKVVEAVKSLEDDLQGVYYPLSDMDQDSVQQLVKEHYLFSNDDKSVAPCVGGCTDGWMHFRCLEIAGAYKQPSHFAMMSNVTR